MAIAVGLINKDKRGVDGHHETGGVEPIHKSQVVRQIGLRYCTYIRRGVMMLCNND